MSGRWFIFVQQISWREHWLFCRDWTGQRHRGLEPGCKRRLGQVEQQWQVSSHATGSGNINIESGRDTNLKDVVVESETITAIVGGDLTSSPFLLRVKAPTNRLRSVSAAH